MEKGVNLIGYARAEFGLGEACRSAASALQSANIPFCIINFPYSPSRQNDHTWKHKEVPEPIYNTNIFFINADQLYYYYRLNTLKKSWFVNRYNIGYWHWELPEFPNTWRRCFKLVNEIWVPSRFTANSIAQKTYKPVITIPHAISINLQTGLNRKYFGFANNRYLFFTMYDIHSTSARKNPIAVLKAFKKAFLKDDHTVGLVLKINNASFAPEELKKLKQNIEGYKNVFLIENVLSREEVNGLLSLIDCYVSLHRAEGFGLPIAEAMYLGKAVIATNWSGNVDFMNEKNSCLVDYTLKYIGEDYGPYKAGQKWAEPNLCQAANYMKKLSNDKMYSYKIGQSARRTIKTKLSPQIIGEKYKLNLMKKDLI